MSDFLKPREHKSVVIVLPPKIEADTEFDIIMRTDSWESGDIYIEKDGERLVTVRKNGEVILHQHP